MQNLKKSFFSKFVIALVGLSSTVLASCDNPDDVLENGNGSMAIKVTDAPADNEEIEAVFVTVTNIKIDGESVSGFDGPKTINISALQNGKTELLANENVKAGSYQTISLELDFETDEDGNSPGTYIKKTDGTKQKISAEGKSEMEYMFQGNTRVMENSESTVVLDFDLRKFIKSEESAGYSLAGSSELAGYLRFADEDYSGHLKGNYSGTIDSNEEVVVYVYKKGEFDADTEMHGSSGIQFKHAVASAIVSKGITGNSYDIHYLDEGEYEVHFISYEENNTSGELQVQGEMNVESEMNLSEIEIKAGVESTINVTAHDLLG